LLKLKLKWKRDYMNEEESNEFLLKMMESNRERIDYEIDDDLFDMSIFDRDGNLIGFNWERK
tara:strand:+ start:257 stop:442 length:186 start_codon:yes stop_codon:yes gene_type:complete